jgi:serine phosphatase RsbU (regulator of sigma subunit)/DNA-binding NarL/FixJ family response regulator
MTLQSPLRMVIAESRDIVRQGLRAVLSASEQVHLLGEAQDAAELRQLCELVQPEVALVGAGLPGLGSPEEVRRMCEHLPRIRLALLCSPGEAECFQQGLEAGAVSMLSLDLSSGELVGALLLVAQGQPVRASEAAEIILRADHLSRLEQEVRQEALELAGLAQAIGRHLPNVFPGCYIQVRLYPQQDLFTAPGLAELPAGSLLIEPAWKWLRSQEAPLGFTPGVRFPWGGEQPAGCCLVLGPIRDAGRGQPVGGLGLIIPGPPEDLDEVLPIVGSIAVVLAAALEKAREQDSRPSPRSPLQELEMAGRIQAGILPEKPPALRGWDLAARLIPARETSGDYFDFIPLEKDRLGIVIADVTDKGLGAAVIMALSNTLIRTYATRYPTLPAFAMSSVNERILSDTRGGMFVTSFYGILEPETGRLRYVNAGHNPPFLLSRQKGKPVDRLFRTGMALGILKEASWQQKIVKLVPGDVLVLYTDGITESVNAQGEQFGEKRLLEAIRPAIGRPAEEIQQAALTALQRFTGGGPPQDDITLVVLAHRGAGFY